MNELDILNYNRFKRGYAIRVYFYTYKYSKRGIKAGVTAFVGGGNAESAVMQKAKTLVGTAIEEVVVYNMKSKVKGNLGMVSGRDAKILLQSIRDCLKIKQMWRNVDKCDNIK